MNFHSLAYLLFLPAVAAGYFLLPQRLRNPFLALVSYGFYMLWQPGFALLLLGATAVGYFAARRMDGKKLRLAAALVCLLGLLVYFKYAGFLGELAGMRMPAIALPVGISFFTFTICGYLIDVYRGKCEAETNFINLALFVAFFPQLLSGPIVRADKMLPQYRQTHRLAGEDLRAGFTMFLWGLFKKVVIADAAAVAVNTFYAAPGDFDAVQTALAMGLYTVQIYCDFSSYSDMAIGSARVLGFDLGENFRRPYLASSIKDFWRRWHISLSSWFRDYLYIPLGGSRRGRVVTYVNLMIVFLVSGLWHGAAVTYLVWGGLNGLYQLVGDMTRPLRKKLPVPRWLSVLCTLGLTAVAWVFFRAESLEQAVQILSQLARLPLEPLLPLELTALGLERPQLKALVCFIGLLAAVELAEERRDIFGWLNGRLWLRYAVYVVLAGIILIFGAYGPGYDPQQFVYFQF